MAPHSSKFGKAILASFNLRAILRAGVYELLKRRDVPVAVIVSEYVDIAKAFYEDEELPLFEPTLAIDSVLEDEFGPTSGDETSRVELPAAFQAFAPAMIYQSYTWLR